MLEVRHKWGYANVLRGIEIVARMYENGRGGYLVKVLHDGHDTTANSEQEALRIITQRCCNEDKNRLGVSR